MLLFLLEAESDGCLMFLESAQYLVHVQVSKSDEEPLVDLLLEALEVSIIVLDGLYSQPVELPLQHVKL